MKTTLRALAALLAYPSAELTAHAAEIRAVIGAEKALPRRTRHRLEPLLSRLESVTLLELQADFSELFDRSRALSLHLFEHVHGDSRERGQAMVDLARQYLDAGCLIDSDELPDFAPLFLEYASCLEPAEARETLAQPLHVFTALAERLERRASPYAAVFEALVALAGARPDTEALEALRRHAPDDDIAAIDEEWEEAPVAFTRPGTHAAGQPAGTTATITAVGRAKDILERRGVAR